MSSLITFVCLLYLASAKDILSKSDTPPAIVIHATNYTSVPSVQHIVDAVELLKEAFSVFPDPSDRVKLYAELYKEKHNETNWNVVAGYSAAYIKSQWYVETQITEGGKNKESKKDKEKEKDTFYLIFSTV